MSLLVELSISVVINIINCVKCLCMCNYRNTESAAPPLKIILTTVNYSL